MGLPACRKAHRKEETSAPDESEQPVSESTAEGLAEESIITETMHIEVPAQPEEDQPEEETQGLMAGLFSLFRANGTAPDVKLSEDNQWLVGMDTTMEYITLDKNCWRHAPGWHAI